MILPNSKIEAACAKCTDRLYLNAPILDAERKRLVASDGHILAVVPVEVDPDDTSGSIPLEAVKRARAISKHSPQFIRANGTAAALDGLEFPRPWRSAVSAKSFLCGMQTMIEKAPAATAAPDIALNAELLLRLAQALTDKGKGKDKDKPLCIGLWFARDKQGRIDPNTAIRVQPLGHPERIGLIMPMRF